MSKRLFDPALLDATLEANATRRDPLPPGEVIAQIESQELTGGTVKKQGSKNFGQPWTRLDCSLVISDPDYLRQVVGNDGSTPVKTTLGIMLDMTEAGTIATGPNKNVRLGRFREAAGVNGKPLSALVGQYVRIAIGHKPHPEEEGVVLDEIVGYTKP